jgi:hypothetical protein
MRNTIDLGHLPVAMINKALGFDLEPGPLLLDDAAFAHIAEDHPADLDAFFAIWRLAKPPNFAGQGWRSDDEKFQIVWGFDGSIVKVIVGRHWRPSTYRVVSGYCITRQRLCRERFDRTLVPLLY